MTIGVENIEKALSGSLPGSHSHKKMLPPGRDLLPQPNDPRGIRKSSVLLLLFQDKEEIYACLIKRPAHMKHHAGQIALPGGKIEKHETALETAYRETMEEVGINQEKITLLGSLSELYVGVSRFLIHPYVGWLKEKPIFTINTNEVEKIILFPLFRYVESFVETELETITGKLKVPCIQFEDEIIWGATAMILSEFYDATKATL